MADKLTNVCTQNQFVDLGAIDPQDGARAQQFTKEMAPKLDQACKAEAKVAEAKAKVEAARKEAFDAGVVANGNPSTENQGKREAAQKKLGAALRELSQAEGALKKIQTELIQARDRFKAMTQTKATTPAAVRLMGGSPASTKATPPEETKESGANVPDRTLKDHQVAPVKARFKLASQDKNGLRGSH